MLIKSYTGTIVAGLAIAGGILLAKPADATAYTYSCAANNAACASAFASLGSNGSTGSSADSVNWGLFANSLNTPQNNGAIANNASATTPNNDTVKVSSGDSNPFTTYVEGQGTGPTGSGRNAVAGTAWDGMFGAATTVLFTSDGAIKLSFNTPLIGLGIDAQIFNAGTYLETLTAYNSVGTIIGVVSQTGTSGGVTSGVTSAEGTAPFVGISTDAQNNTASLNSNGISYITIAAACTDVGCTSGGFAIDTSLIYHYPIVNNGGGNPVTTPEPGTLALLGAGLVALGYARRRQQRTAA